MRRKHNMPARDSLSRVSVIIPTHNRSKLLCSAVESVLAQTYPNVEIIVVDDGSTDDTAVMMAQYAGRVIYIKQANQGPIVARNTGFEASSGQYINFLDDDDLLMLTKIERQVQVLDSRPEIGLAYCRHYHIDQDGGYLDEVGYLPDGDVLRELTKGCFLVVHAALVRRQCLDKVGLFDTDLPWGGQYCEDWDLWLRIARAGYQFACVQELLCAYRIHQGGRVANVANEERASFAVLGNVFADPHLPSDIVATKDEVYGMCRVWIGFRYYAADQWEDAQRNLTEGLSLCPQLLEHPEDLLQILCGDALGARVSDPVKFITDVFDHLPPRATNLRPHRSQALRQVYVGLALRSYRVGDIIRAKDQLIEAIALDPTVLEQTDQFAETLRYNALSLPVDAPLRYVDRVLRNLPAEAQQLKRIRSRVLGDVSVASAFQDYAAGRRDRVIGKVLTALRYCPSWLGNRGVISIFVKSLIGLSNGTHYRAGEK